MKTCHRAHRNPRGLHLYIIESLSMGMYNRHYKSHSDSKVYTQMKSATGTLKIRRSAKAKRLRLAVKPGQIELVIPRGTGEAQAMAFLDQHRAWAEGKLLELNDQASRIPSSGSFASSPTLPWRGREVPLIIREAPGLRIRVSVDEAVHICPAARTGRNPRRSGSEGVLCLGAAVVAYPCRPACRTPRLGNRPASTGDTRQAHEDPMG